MNDIGRVATALRAGFLDFDAISFADALWAAQYLPPSVRTSPIALPPIETNPSAKLSPPGLQREDEAEETAAATASAPTPPTSTSMENPHSSTTSAAGERQPAPGAASLLYGEPDPNARLTSGIPVSPLRMPAGAALPNGLEIVRALGAIPVCRPSRIEVELDTDATVERTADNGGLLMPLTCPVTERWFDAAIVVELTPSAEMWSDTVIELERLLRYAGVFRDVRVQYLDVSKKEARLVSRGGQAARPQTLSDPTGGRIIMLFGTGISPAWTDGRIGAVLAIWSRTIPVALVHALPESMWPQTRLGRPPAVFEAATIGASNEHLRGRGRAAFWARRLRLDFDRLPLPVIALEANSARRWSEMIAHRRGTPVKAFLIPRHSIGDGSRSLTNRSPATGSSLADVGARVARLAARAPHAYRLASVLASAPFSLPLVRLVHAALYGRADQNIVLAELMLSGLIERLRDGPAGARFRFVGPAGEVLRRASRVDDAREVSTYLARYLREPGGTGAEAQAYYRDALGTDILALDTKPFAELHDSLIRTLLGIAPHPGKGMTAHPARFDPYVMADELVVGRDDDIIAVDAALQRTNFVAIVGPPGIGKSTLARAVARAGASRYDVIWRLDAGATTSLFASVAALRAALGLAPAELRGAQIELIQELLIDINHTTLRVLLIGDDVSYAWAQDVFAAGWQATGDRMGTLLTTRVARRLPHSIAVHRLGSLTTADSATYLAASSGSRHSDPKDLKAIARVVGSSPAALSFAARTLHHPTLTPDTYVELIEKKLTKILPSAAIDARMWASLSQLVSIAEVSAPGALTVFFTLCSLGNDAVPRRVVPLEHFVFGSSMAEHEDDTPVPTLSETQVLDALNALERFGIISMKPDGAVQVPRFASQLVRKVLESQDIPWWRHAVKCLSEAFAATSNHDDQLDLLPIAAYVLEDSRMREFHADGALPSASSLTGRAQLAIDCAHLAHRRARAASADSFARDAASSIRRMGELGQPDAGLEFEYDRLRALLPRKKPVKPPSRKTTTADEKAPAPPAAGAAKMLSERQLRALAKRELGTDDLRILALLTSRKRNTWLIAGGDSIIHVYSDRSAVDGAVEWRLKIQLARVRSVRDGAIRLGRLREVAYSQKLHPDYREFVKAIHKLIGTTEPPLAAASQSSFEEPQPSVPERPTNYAFSIADLTGGTWINARASRCVAGCALDDESFIRAFFDRVREIEKDPKAYAPHPKVRGVRLAQFSHGGVLWELLFSIEVRAPLILQVCPSHAVRDADANVGVGPAAGSDTALSERASDVDRSHASGSLGLSSERWRVLMSNTANRQIVEFGANDAEFRSALANIIEELARKPKQFGLRHVGAPFYSARFTERYSVVFTVESGTLSAAAGEVLVLRIVPSGDDSVPA